MDVTFHESQSFYPKSSLQGENSGEAQFWEIIPETQSSQSSPQIPEIPESQLSPQIPEIPQLSQTISPVPDPLLPDNQIAMPNPNEQAAATTELRVYSRRQKHVTQPQLSQVEPTSTLTIPQQETGMETGSKSDDNESLTIVDRDDDLPIALKGVRKCTQHPIQNYLSHAKLSHRYTAFTSKPSDHNST